MIDLRLPAVLMLGMLASCGPAATKGGFDSPNPAAKMYAIEQAARAGDRSAIRSIVEQLESDDPAVRCLAIATLKRLTGETFGYRDFDPPEQRRAAVERWLAAVESGQVPEPSNPNSSTAELHDHQESQHHHNTPNEADRG